MYLSDQSHEKNDRIEKIAQTPQEAIEVKTINQDLRMQFKKDDYENFDVRQQLKRAETTGNQSIIQCLKSYGDIAYGRVLKIAGKRNNMDPEVELQLPDIALQEVNNDTDNSIYNIPGKDPGKQFSNIVELKDHLNSINGQYGREIGTDIIVTGSNAYSFNGSLQSVKQILSDILIDVLFPMDENGKQMYIFNENQSGFDLAKDIMPSIEKDRHYTAKSVYTEIAGVTTEEYNETIKNKIEMGWGTGPKQEVHEVGHVLENEMTVDDFLKVHRFIRARTNRNNPELLNVGWPDFSVINAYNAYLPEMNIYEQAYGNKPGLDKLSMISTKLNPLKGQNGVDKLFAQKSNSMDTHYATGFYSDDGTEFISTTAELFASGDHTMELIKEDPFRAVFFLYMTNRNDIFPLVSRKYNESMQDGNDRISLEKLIHVD